MAYYQDQKFPPTAGDASLSNAEICNENDIDRSSNLFLQLDAMIAAVQSESTAIDNMRDKVKELDSLKEEVVILNRRLLESEQVIHSYKGKL